ncbi:hypothetical protein SK128_016486 [Halocaridina rubra]|uniref:Uncharacterized protein n=1 Tax=Halocaridina rubra TaxID=373956 RepID=A0AAN8X7N1_HALRR
MMKIARDVAKQGASFWNILHRVASSEEVNRIKFEINGYVYIGRILNHRMPCIHWVSILCFLNVL